MDGDARRAGLVASLSMVLYACGSAPASKGDGATDAPAFDGGAAGTMGAAGAGGAGGTAGVAGASGAGAGGTTGVAGAGGAGAGGTTGVAGRGGAGAGGTTGVAGAGGAAGATGAGGTTVPVCAGGVPAVLDTSPFVATPAPGMLNSNTADKLAISADNWVHLYGTAAIFSAPDGVMFTPGDPRNVAGPFAIDQTNNWIYVTRADAAQKWSVWRYPTSGGCASKVYDFAVDVDTPRLAGVSNGVVIVTAVVKGQATAEPTVFLGTGGTAWAMRGKLPYVASISSGAVSRTNPNRLWLGGLEINNAAIVFASGDGGMSFNFDLLSEPVGGQAGQGRAVIAADPANDRVAYAIAQNTSMATMTTTDGGATWVHWDTPSQNQIAVGLEVSASGTQWLSTKSSFTGLVDGSFYTRPSATAAWASASGDLPTADVPVRSFAVRERAGAPPIIVRLSITGTLWRSENGGTTYTRILPVGAPGMTMSQPATDPDNAAIFYANDRSGHLWRTTNGGATFTAVAAGYQVTAVVLTGGGMVLPGGTDTDSTKRIYYSRDGGVTVARGGYGTLPAEAALGHAVLAGRAPNTAYLAYTSGSQPGTVLAWNHVHVSTDGGYNWTMSGQWLPTTFTGAAWVFVDPATAGRLYRVLTPTGGASMFFVSPNDAGAWVEVPLPASASGAPVVVTQDVLKI